MPRAQHSMPPLETIVPSFAEFFENTPIALKLLDAQNHILYANSAFQHLVAYDLERLRQLREQDLIHPVDLYEFRERFAKIVAHDIEFSEIEVRHRHADGHWFPTLLNHIWLSTPGENIEYILEIVVDLTNRCSLVQPSAYFDSRQLLGQMARGVAHDFNNLLTILMMKLAIIENLAADDAPTLDQLHRMGEVLTRMQHLSENLARFGDVAQDAPETTDVNAAIRNMEDYFRFIIPPPVHLQLALSEGLAQVHASTVELEQILLNLVVNASDAILRTHKPGTITIRTANCPPDTLQIPHLLPAQYIMFSVSDDGAGMDLDVLERIFEPHFSTKDKPGTGIGLATVQAIIQQARGGIDVKSAPGEGTRFDVYLPAVDK